MKNPILVGTMNTPCGILTTSHVYLCSKLAVCSLMVLCSVVRIHLYWMMKLWALLWIGQVLFLGLIIPTFVLVSMQHRLPCRFLHIVLDVPIPCAIVPSYISHSLPSHFLGLFWSPLLSFPELDRPNFAPQEKQGLLLPREILTFEFIFLAPLLSHIPAFLVESRLSPCNLASAELVEKDA